MNLTIKVTEAFINQMDQKIKDNTYNFGDVSFDTKRRRLECELYEWEMCHRQAWEPGKTWATDGISDKYGHVDVKVIGLDRHLKHNGPTSGKPWWNISQDKMRNICRQYGVIDHYYFIKWARRPEGLLIAGDEVEFDFIGVLTYEEVMKQIQTSQRGGGFYIDTRKAHG